MGRILERQRTGDQAASVDIAAAYDRYGKPVFGLCLRMTGRIAIAEELVQETFIKLMHHAADIGDEQHLKAWLFRTASNLAISRSRRLEVWRRVRGWVNGESPEPVDPVVRNEVQTALMQLPEGYRVVLLLHDVAGMTHDEIARARGCAVGTAKSQLSRARVRLAELLQ